MNEIGNPSSQMKADDSQLTIHSVSLFTNIVDRHPWVAKKEVTRAQHKSWLSGLKPVNLDLGSYRCLLRSTCPLCQFFFKYFFNILVKWGCGMKILN